MNQGAFTDHVFQLNAELLQQRDKRRIEELRKFAEQQRRMFLKWRGAASWVAEHMPDMVEDGEVCPFATHAAIDLKRLHGGDLPSPDEVRRYRRERWAHVREGESAA